MFSPPDSLNSLKALQWAAPSWTWLAWLGTAWAFGLSLSTALLVAFAAAVLATCGAVAAVWLSRFGTRHSRMAVIGVFVAFCVPISVIMMGSISSQEIAVMAAIGLVVVHGCLLLFASLMHARKAGPLPDLAANRLTRWGGLAIRADLGTWHADKDAIVRSKPLGHVAVGSAAVLVYGVLSSMLDADAMPLAAFVIGNALCASLCVGPLARSLSQSMRIAGWERERLIELSHAEFSKMELERRQSLMGRVLRRRFGI
ncbi:MAG: hypothetical protein IV093_16995 [Rubrivivax sp.]|nr:hypothetical protein [Rubrivivax sp.]